MIREEKKIVIKLPDLQWSSFLSIRFLLVFSLLLFATGFAYWYQNMRPFLWISSARIESFSTILNADVAGRIVEMGPQEGDFVKRGQVLVVLDRDLILAKQAQLKGALDALNAQVELEKGRIGKAMEEYLTATSELGLGIETSDQVKKHLALMEEAQEKSESAFSKLTTAKAELDLLNLQVKKMSLPAPFDGVILKRSKNPGAVVSFGEPIYVLSDPDRLWIEAEISENDIGNIAIGTPARIRLVAYPKKELLGKISYIGPATLSKSSFLPFTEQKEMIPIKISIDHPDLSLKPGLSASVGLKVR
jgi:RND family efflux transporter MFP subunit